MGVQRGKKGLADYIPGQWTRRLDSGQTRVTQKKEEKGVGSPCQTQAELVCVCFIFIFPCLYKGCRNLLD